MVVSRGNTQAIAVRTLNEIDYHIVAGTTQTLTVSSPAFSPDNQWLVFWSDSALKKVAVTGGVPVTLCKSGQPFGLTWQDGWIVYSAVNATHAIYRVSENGGEPEALIQIDPPELAYGPSLIDGGAAVLYTLATSRDFVRWDQANVVVQRLGSTERTVVVRGGTDARYVPTGHLVYALMGSLMGQRFDEKTARIQGAPVPLIEGLAGPLGGPSVTGVAHYAFSPTGVLAYAPGRTTGAGDELTVVLASRDGTVEQLPLPPRAYSQPRLSPDGKQLALVVDDRGGPQVWIFAMGSQGPARRLTFDGANTWPVWTRDGRFVTFQSDRSGSRGIYRQPADGSGAAEQLTKADAESAHVPESWAPDGRTLLYRVVAPGTQTLWTMSASGERTTQLFAPVADGRAQVTATFSPDGRWVAYGSNQLGSSAYFVFVEPFPRTGAKYQVTTTATSTPVWSADGRQIFFAFSDRVMAADISTAPEFRFGQPVAWKSEGSLASGASLRNFDVTPDGKRLLLLTPPPSPDGRAFDADQLYVVVNWFEELRAKLPTP
jgi:Tol biopolymer transport system component